MGARAFVRQLITPASPEPLSEAHLRRIARLLVRVAIGLAALNVIVIGRYASGAGADRNAIVLYTALNLPAHGLYGVLNYYAARESTSLAARRRIAVISSAAMIWTALLGIWALGGLAHISASMFTLIGIASFRIVYDARIGLYTLGLALAIHGGLIGLHAAGVITPGAVLPGASGVMTDRADVMAIQFASFACAYVLAWVGASYVANRYRDSEHALRQAADARDRLRERLAQIETNAESVDEPRAPVSLGRLSGTLFDGRYQMMEMLGAGGMGDVYLAHRIEDRKAVAIKVLRPQLSDVPRMLERFQREAGLAARIPGAHVPEVLGTGMADGYHYIAMEYLRGEDLGALLRRRDLGRGELVPIVNRIAEALDAAHDAGIVHRDLKPANVFLIEDEQGERRVRLLDFGISRLLEGSAGLTATEMVLGSPGYLAPEQAKGDPTALGPHTDVFALGAIVYRALTGKDAFPSRDIASAVHEALFVQPAAPSTIVPSLPTDVDLVLRLALAKRPDRRYARASELAADLEAALASTLGASSRVRAEAFEPTPTIEAPMPAAK